jgi:hypothetical protein
VRPILHFAVEDGATFEAYESLFGMLAYGTIERGVLPLRQAARARDNTGPVCTDPGSIAPTTRPERRSLRRVFTNASDTSVVEYRRGRIGLSGPIAARVFGRTLRALPESNVEGWTGATTLPLGWDIHCSCP